MSLNIKLIEPSTDAHWQQYYHLRWQVLREPWGKPPGSERDDLEDTSRHILSLVDNNPAGVGRVHALNETTAQIRYMAVSPDYQRRGIGGRIILALEDIARSLGKRQTFLNARKDYHSFYIRQGYTIQAEGFTLYDTIEHFEMLKPLLK